MEFSVSFQQHYSFYCLAPEGAYRCLSTSESRCSSRCSASKQAASQLTRETLKSCREPKLSLSATPHFLMPLFFLPGVSGLPFRLCVWIVCWKTQHYCSHRCYIEASPNHNTRNQFSLLKKPIKGRQGALKHLLKTITVDEVFCENWTRTFTLKRKL